MKQKRSHKKCTVCKMAIKNRNPNSDVCAGECYNKKYRKAHIFKLRKQAKVYRGIKKIERKKAQEAAEAKAKLAPPPPPPPKWDINKWNPNNKYVQELLDREKI